MTDTISSGVYVVTDGDGLVLATLVDWSLALAQEVARSLESNLEEPTYLHFLTFGPNRAPSLGESVSMTGVKLRRAP